MKTKVSFSGILLFLFFTTLGFGQANQTAVPALRVEPDAISTGRGFTGVAQPTEASAVYWNPAGLAWHKGTQLGMSRFKWLPDLDSDLSYSYLMGRYHVEGVGTFGGHITYLDLGSQSFRDRQGNSTGNFSSYEFSAGISLGRVAIPNTLTLGLGVRFVSSRLAPSGVSLGGIETETGNSFGVDLGALYKPGDYTVMGIHSTPTIGLAITNFGGRVTYSNSGYKTSLPTIIRLGVANEILLDSQGINTLTISADLSKFLVSSDSTGAEPAFQSLFSSWDSYQYFNGRGIETVTLGEQLMLGMGLEYWYNNLLALRTGFYTQSKDNGGRQFLTFGGSIKYSYLQINASYAMPQRQSATGNIFRVGVLLNL